MNDIIKKILNSDPKNIYNLLKSLDENNLLNEILPELVALKGVNEKNNKKHKDNFLHTLKVVEKTYHATDNIYLRFASIIHDIGKKETKKFINNIGWTFHNHEYIGSKKVKKIFKRLNLNLDKIKYVENIVRYHGRIKELIKDGVTDSALRRLDKDMCGYLEDLILFCKCDITTKFKDKEQKIISDTDMIYKEIIRIRKIDEDAKWRPPIDGYQIMKIMNLKPGKELGDIINNMKNVIKNGEIDDNYESAYKYLMNLKNN